MKINLNYIQDQSTFHQVLRNITSSGSGNSHKLSMTKQLTKTIIGLDGVVQQPVTFTKISHTLGVFDGFTHNSNIGVGLTQFILSGIGSNNF